MFRIVFRSLLVLMLIASAAPAFAQEAEPEAQADEAAEKATEEGRVFKDQIVVTPGRYEQASGDAPAPITVFDRDEIEKIPEGITQGSGMAPTLRSSPLFPPVVVNMVAIGEETGQLPDVLLRVADSYEIQVERAIKTVTSIIEPIIILVLGLIVFVIVLAMLLPVFSIDPTKGM